MSSTKRKAASKTKRAIRKRRCPFHSRAWGCRCERDAGHEGNCDSAGDGFVPGYDPRKPETKFRAYEQ